MCCSVSARSFVVTRKAYLASTEVLLPALVSLVFL